MEERKIFVWKREKKILKKKSNSTYAGTVLLVEHYATNVKHVS